MKERTGKNFLVDYWPDEDDFDDAKSCGEFFNALGVLEGIGRVNEMVRFLESGRTLSPGVARTLAYIIAGGELEDSNPEREHGPFVFKVEERRPAHRCADPKTRMRAEWAAFDVWKAYDDARKCGKPFSFSKECEIARKAHNVGKETLDSAIFVLEASIGERLPRDPRGRKSKNA